MFHHIIDGVSSGNNGLNFKELKWIATAKDFRLYHSGNVMLNIYIIDDLKQAFIDSYFKVIIINAFFKLRVWRFNFKNILQPVALNLYIIKRTNIFIIPFNPDFVLFNA